MCDGPGGCAASGVANTATGAVNRDGGHPDRQTAEIKIRVAFINPFNALGIAEILRIA
jgi:hypothetical protein